MALTAERILVNASIRMIPLVALVLSFAGVSCRAQHATPATASTSLGQPEDFFPIMPWELTPEASKRLSDPRQGIESLKECGFNTVGFANAAQLKTCEKLGLRAIVRPPISQGQVKWRELSDDQIFQTVKKQIDELLKSHEGG